MAFLCLINETDSPYNLTLLIIYQSNANFKTEWVIQNESLPLILEKSSISMCLHGKAVTISKKSRFFQL